MIQDFSRSGTATAGGRLAMTGIAASLHSWLDARVRAMALADGAHECHFPASIARETLDRAGYFDSFPDGAAAIGTGPRTDFFLTPAVCFHAYALLADRTIEQPLTLTACQTCFREADRGAGDSAITRLWEFTMREVIFVGTAEWVASRVRDWTDRTGTLARELELTGTIEPATDAFYGDLSRGQRLIQQLKHLKHELRIAIGGSPVAVASFNLHETHFGRRFDLTLADGSPAHSGCAAFGIERWALALLAERGEQAAARLLKG